MLKGRLGLARARVPHSDRHGSMWLGRGTLFVDQGTLRFATAGGGELDAGDYAIPFQMVSCLLLEPGASVTHDALRLLARHGTTLLFIGEDGVRFYASLAARPKPGPTTTGGSPSSAGCMAGGWARSSPPPTSILSAASRARA